MLATLLGFGTAAYNNQAAAEREARARAENYKYGEMAANNADKRTRDLYKDLQSPTALLEQYKNAGLSPSLMFGGGGSPGGVTAGAQGTGATGVNPNTYGAEAKVDPMSAAQIALTIAQTKKTEAETNTMLGENDRGQAEIAKTWAEAGATEAAEQLTKAETSLKNINTYVADKTKDFNVTRARYESEKAMDDVRKAYWEAEDAGLQFQYNAATFETRVEKAANEVAELASRIAMQHSQSELNTEQKNAIKDYVEQGYIDCAVRAKNATQYANYVEAYAENLPKQIELRKEEIGLEKWRIGADAFNNLVRTAGYIAGATQLGDGGYEEMEKEIYQEGNKHVETERTRKRNKLPKRPMIRR